MVNWRGMVFQLIEYDFDGREAGVRGKSDCAPGLKTWAILIYNIKTS
jgi:hypothetical protein